jgi:Zn finger protein HypA/HybF involved in hydrogenase expression
MRRKGVRKMDDLKFRLKVRKLKCNDCDTISLIEFKQPQEVMYVCPLCMEPMEELDEIIVSQE